MAGHGMIKQLLNLVTAKYDDISQINYLPWPSALANNLFADHEHITTDCSTSSNNCKYYTSDSL